MDKRKLEKIESDADLEQEGAESTGRAGCHRLKR